MVEELSRRTSPKAFALGEVDLTKSKTDGAALQSNAVEVAEKRSFSEYDVFTK